MSVLKNEIDSKNSKICPGVTYKHNLKEYNHTVGPREDYISGANKHWEPLFYNSFASKVKNWFPASKQKRTIEFDQKLAELHYRQFLAKICCCERYLRSHIGSH